MPFADIEIKFNKGENTFKRTEFMELKQGVHVIRVLQEQAKTLPTHFFNAAKASVLCLGESCPICATNKHLILEYPNNFRDQPSYIKVNYRFFVNVLDKTPAKVCTKCGIEYKNLAATVCNCGTVLPQAAPLNKVKMLSKGLTLRDDLDSIDRAILSPEGEPIGLTHYDIILMVSGTGRETKITPVPKTDSTEPVDLSTLELFDINKAVIELTPEELLDLQRGISLKDIFSARKTEKLTTVEPVVNQEELNKINDAVNTLFNQE